MIGLGQRTVSRMGTAPETKQAQELELKSGKEEGQQSNASLTLNNGKNKTKHEHVTLHPANDMALSASELTTSVVKLVDIWALNSKKEVPPSTQPSKTEPSQQLWT